MSDRAVSGDPSASPERGWAYLLRDFVDHIPNGQTIPDNSWRSRHRGVFYLLLAHVPFMLALGLYEGTESISGATIPSIPLGHVLVELGVIVALAALARWAPIGRRGQTAVATLGLVVTSGILVHFSGGYIEAHFHFFVVMAVVAIYEDWLPFGLGIVFVAVQHGVFGMIDPSRVYNHGAAISNPWVWAFIHAAFVLGLAAALMTNWYSTERSRRKADERLEEAEAKTAEVEDLQARKAEIEQAKADAEAAQAEAEARKREVEQLNERLEATADDYSATMARAADGDLGVRLDTSADSEALAQIARSFNEMMDETESAMREIQAFADEVATASEAAAADADRAEDTSVETSETLQDLSEDADRQRERLEGVADEMTDLSAAVEEIAASAETVAETSHETATIAADGEETARSAIEDARAVEDAIDETVANVEALDSRMTEIEEIVELIGDIAEQTNILALNANIEAARAGTGGGGGDGFTVVANEVKQLANETRESAAEIETLIEETKAQTETTVAEARAAEEYIDAEVAAVEDVVEAFQQVAENAERTDEGIQEISDTTDDQAQSTADAVSAVEAVAEDSRATAEETATASAAAGDQADFMARVSGDIASLSERAERLQDLLESFDADDGPGAVGGSEAGTAADGGRR